MLIQSRVNHSVIISSEGEGERGSISAAAAVRNQRSGPHRKNERVERRGERSGDAKRGERGERKIDYPPPPLIDSTRKKEDRFFDRDSQRNRS